MKQGWALAYIKKCKFYKDKMVSTLEYFNTKKQVPDNVDSIIKANTTLTEIKVNYIYIHNHNDF